ncbi:MAG: hypothetical protein WCX65_10295 [bacterium]
MDFIFMLTRQDMTIGDCLDVFDLIVPTGVTHIGCKDVGVDIETLRELIRRIKAAGCTSYLEVVSTTPEACLNSARIAVDIGVERLLGGTDAANILKAIEGSGVKYYPFPGRPEGHPTKLGGTPESVAADCARFEKLGCAGVDLLAYRAFEADPLDLVRAARGAMKGYLACAGSVDSPERIQALAAAGADAFTIGSAIFDGSFSKRKGSILSQIKDVLAACK